MSAADNDKKPTIKRLIGEPTEAVDMKTTLRGNGKGGYLALTTFNGHTYSGEGWSEQQAQTKLKEKINTAIAEGKFDTNR
jgi:hypothetical protein